nr:hypothetical protein [uncultured Blautia sp.]
MNREIFVLAVKKLLLLQTEENVKKWVAWVEECVDMKQYDGYREMPRIQAVEKWLDSYYASFRSVQSEFDRDSAIKVLNLSQERLCLYPYEIRMAAQILKDGGTGKDILQMIHKGTLEENTAKMEKCREVKCIDTNLYYKENLYSILQAAKAWQEDPVIPLPYKPVDSLVVQLTNACMELLEFRFGIMTIQKSDYDLIAEHAFFLVNSAQVMDPEEVDLDAVYECFNDAKVNERMIEVAEQCNLKMDRGSNISEKTGRQR